MAVVVGLLGLALMPPLGAGQAALQDQSPPTPALDLVVVDRDGRFVEDLRAADITVTVDGARRKVLWLRRVSRGPGALTEATMRRERTAGSEVGFAAEPARTVVLVIDEAALARGDERTVVRAAASFVDRLGLVDRVAVLRIPSRSDLQLALTTERSAAREALSRVAGQLVAESFAPAIEATPEGAAPQDPAGLEANTPKPVDAAALARDRPEEAAQAMRASLLALHSLFESLGRVPGRKTVALFSGGLPPADPLLDEAAFAAASSHVVVYAFGTPAASPAYSAGSLERLASATGGAYAALGRNPARVVERAAGELGACYVAGLEPVAQGGAAARRGVRVATAAKGTIVRTAAWLVDRPDAGDQLPVAPSAAGAKETAEPKPAAEAPARKEASDPELPVALARLFDYADGYELQYSMLVAEEDYRQSASAGGRVHLRSDLLLVRPRPNDEWVSFRDVFEVDGHPVRDREERLRRLFLDQSAAAAASLKAIRDESARYNVGSVERTVNVPLLPLSFIRPANRHRFDYALAGRGEVEGIGTWRIRYTEREFPTMVEDAQHKDLPVSGWFVIDRVTGSIVETRIEAKRGEASGEIVVRYRRDEGLGLWVPVEMRELYRQPEPSLPGRWGGISRSSLEGRAVYSNFRRFRVTTEEKVAPLK